MPSLARYAMELKGDDERIRKILSKFNSRQNLSRVLRHIMSRLENLESLSFD
jgi:phosphopantothenate synthetase